MSKHTKRKRRRPRCPVCNAPIDDNNRRTDEGCDWCEGRGDYED